MFHCVYRGVTGYNFQIKKKAFFSQINFVLANSEGPDEMLHLALKVHTVNLEIFAR